MINPSHVQKLDRVDLNDFRILATALAKARAEDIPTYCPTLFGEVLTLWKQAQNEAASTGSASQVRKQLEEAMKKLDQASKRAASSRDSFSDLVHLRTDSQRNVWERYYASEILIEAERYYWLVIREAENGKLGEADKHAATARKLFREAIIQSLEYGPIARLENQVIEAEQTVPQGRLQDAARELAGLREILAKTQKGDLTVSALRTRITVGREAIRSLLTLAPDLNLDGDGPIFDPGMGGLIDPGWTLSPPEAPVTMRIGERTESSLTVWWLNQSSSMGPLDLSSADVNKLIRQKEDGPWEVVAEFGHLSGWTNYTDTALQPDTRYCYRVRTENTYAYGSKTTLQPNEACGYTRRYAPDGKKLMVWRAQLTIRTADVPGAGSGDGVKVLLNSPLITYAPSGNSTWLDYGPRLELAPSSPYGSIWIDDFARGREFSYDLNLSNISELSDITMLTIVKDGTDSLGIADISLEVNGVKVFERFFGETASTCLWIDEDDGYSSIYAIWHSELRAHPSWQAYIASQPSAPLTIRNEEMVSRLESMIGNAIHGTEAYWDTDNFYAPAWVEATRLDNETLQVDVDLGASTPILDDPEVDLDFQLNFKIECNPQAGTATLKVTTLNFRSNVDFGILDDIFTFGVVEFFEDYVAKSIQNAFQPITQTIVLDTGGPCPQVVIDALGNIRFQL